MAIDIMSRSQMGKAAVGGEFVLLDPHSIYIPAGNRPVDPVKVRALQVSIEQRGLLQPIGVRAGRVTDGPHDKRRYTLGFGRHRLLAWQRLLEAMIKTGDQHMIGRFASIPAIVYSSEMPDELLDETTLIENSMRLGRSPRESMFANWTMIAMMKGRGASFDKTEPQAEWVVRLIDAKKKAKADSGQTVGDTGVSPTLRHHDLQRDGLRLAAYLLGVQQPSLLRQQKALEKLSGKKIDIRKDGKQAILNRLGEARKTLAEQQAGRRPAATG